MVYLLPFLSAFVIVFLYCGRSGIWAFLSRLFLWRCSAGWAIFILIGLPLVFVVGSLLKGGPMLVPLPPEGIGLAVEVLFIMLFLGTIEKFGWRGVAQLLLQKHMSPIWAGLLIGAAWGLWHMPAFFLSSTVSGPTELSRPQETLITSTGFAGDGRVANRLPCPPEH